MKQWCGHYHVRNTILDEQIKHSDELALWVNIILKDEMSLHFRNFVFFIENLLLVDFWPNLSDNSS